MSEIVAKIMSFYDRNEYFGLEEHEFGKLTEQYIHILGQVDRYLNGVGEQFVLGNKETRVVLFYLNHLVFNGCPFYKCGGDVLVTFTDAERGRCIECGRGVSDYRR